VNRNCVAGCLLTVLAVVLVIGGVLYGCGPRVVTWGKDWVEGKFNEASADAALERDWAPPGDAPAAEWFPPAIAEFQRSGTPHSNAQLPELGVNLPGFRATYETGGKAVEVFAWRASEVEKDGIFDHAKKAHDAIGGSHWRVQGTNRYYEQRAGRPRLLFWWRKETLFLFRSATEDPRPFSKIYLRSISASPQLEK
jgi:hypothetical protein